MNALSTLVEFVGALLVFAGLVLGLVALVEFWLPLGLVVIGVLVLAVGSEIGSEIGGE